MRGAATVAVTLMAGIAACAGGEKKVDAPPKTAPTTATVSAAASVSGSASVPASASASACFPADPDTIGYDEAADVITLCAKSDCLALPRGRLPQKTTPITTPLAAPHVPHLVAGVEGEGPKLAVAPTSVKLSAARWTNVPFAKAKDGNVLWLSKDGKRALVVRYVLVDANSMFDREHFDLVDFGKHVSLAHAELCNFTIMTGADADDAETIAKIWDGHDNPIVITAFLDLAHAKFVELGPKTQNGYGSCPGPDDYGRFFDDDRRLHLFDLHRIRVGRALLDFEGKRVAWLAGDFPDGPQQGLDPKDQVAEIDADRRVVVRYPSWLGGKTICAGVMRAVAATSDVAPPLDPPRCAPRCETKPAKP
jgi:hypothetical protein